MARSLLAIALLSFLVACGSDSGGGGTGPQNDPPRPTSVTITPATVTLDAVGATTQFSATVRDQNGQSMSGTSVAWSSGSPGILSINSSGLGTAISTGTATVSATAGSATGTASATVQQVAVGLSLSVPHDHVAPGSTLQGTLQLSDANGNPITGANPTWSTRDQDIATVDATGLVTGVAPGLVYVRAEAGNLTDSVQISVAWALQGQEVTATTNTAGEAAVLSNLGGGTHIQIQVTDAQDQPIEGASIQFAEVEDRALIVVRGPGAEHAPAVLFASIDTLAAFGEAFGSSTRPGSDKGGQGPELSISRSILLRVVLPLLTTAELAGIEDVHLLGTFLYQMIPTDLGVDELRRGNICMTWEEFVEEQRSFLNLLQNWADALITLIRGPFSSYFDPIPVEGNGTWHFDPGQVLTTLLAEDVLAEVATLLGETGGESVDGRMVRVEWEFGEGGPVFWNNLGHFRVITNDPHCGGAIPASIQPVAPIVTGAPGATVNPAVLVESTVQTPVPGVDVTFSVAQGHGTLPGTSTTATAQTNQTGIATVPWTLPGAEADYTVTATAQGTGTPLLTTVVGRVIQTEDIEFPPPPVIAAAGGHSCALADTGETFCWGYNWKGELGSGNTSQSLEPVGVSPDPGFNALVARGWHSCGLTTDYKAYCWGANNRAQLGDGTTTERHLPTPVAGELSFSYITAGWFHNCGITKVGKAYCWGYNQYGEVGDGTGNQQREEPTAVSGDHTFRMLAAGGSHTCGLTADGSPYCWGYNPYGELGNGTKNPASVPTPVSGGKTFTYLAAGVNHTCGLDPDGNAYCWGRNHYGQLGTGNTTQYLMPQAVSGELQFKTLGAGLYRTCGLTTDNKAYCWGWDIYGALGDGTALNPTYRDKPYAVADGHTFDDLVTGYYHSCGLESSGDLFCWGQNTFGQLGTGLTSDSAIPAKVSGGHTFGRSGG